MKKRTVIVIIGVAVALWLFLVVVGGIVSMALRLVSDEVDTSGNIAVLEVSGIITSSDELRQQIRRLNKRTDVRGAIIRLDSPGGGVGASQEIFEAIQGLRKKYPVVCSMGSVAASGAFWIAMACDRIVANPGTLTGSIGVIFEYFLFDQVLRKVSVEPVILKSGEFKDAGSPFRKLTPADRALFMDLIHDVYSQFVGVISKSRNLDISKVQKVADGRVFTGRKAKEYGLIDELGGFERALEMAGQLGKVKNPQPFFLRGKSWTDRLFDTISTRLFELRVPRMMLRSVVE